MQIGIDRHKFNIGYNLYLHIVKGLSQHHSDQKPFLLSFYLSNEYFETTVKPAHAVTSIKQSPVLKGHFFLVQS